MKNIDRPNHHDEEIVEAEGAPAPEQTGPLSGDIVERILSRNNEAKQLLAIQMATLGLSEKSICRVLNLNPMSLT